MNMRTLLAAVVVLIVAGSHAGASPPDPLADAHKLMRESKFAEAAPKIDTYLKTNRFDGRAWSSYAICLHGSKDYERSIEAGKRAIELGFNPSGEMYNIACVYTLMGKNDDAIEWLKKSLDAGFADQETLVGDDETKPLRSDPRFIALTGLNPPDEASAEKRWAYDLDFFARRMEQMHWRLYANASKDAFRDEVEKLKVDAPKLSLERVKAHFSKILAMVGDGHTTLAAFAEGQQSLDRIALHTQLFGDELYVIGAPEAQRNMIGSKIVKIGSLAMPEILTRLRAYCSVDNDMGFRQVLPAKLNNPAILQEIGAISGDREDVEYVLQRADGSTANVTLKPVPIGLKFARSSAELRADFVYANAGAKAPTPLYLQEIARPLWAKYLDEQRTMYVGFHAVAENEGQSFEQFVNETMKQIDEKHAENLIIDMRLNGGGNTGLVLPLIHALIKNDRINRPGHLFVIMGRRTFSAAQNTVNLLELHTNATFVGEPTGSRPNFVGESTYFILPYSKLRVYCSSRYWQHVVSTDQRKWVAPQIAAELTFEDFRDNRDPCMEAIFQRIGSQPPKQARGD